MNTNFQVRKVTGYDPGYPVGRRRPGRLETRPLKFLFLVVGFLFFFVGFGCENTADASNEGVPDYNNQNSGADTGPDYDIYEDDTVIPDDDDYVELDGLPSPDMVDIDEVEAPDYDEQLSGADTGPDYDIYEDNAVMPDDDALLTDEQLTGFAGPDEISRK